MTDKQLKEVLDRIEDKPLTWPIGAHPVVTKDFVKGNHAACIGMQISTCPRLPPQRRKQWLSGWRIGRAFFNRMNQNWGFGRRPRSK
jgi:ribosome modulation factor